MAATGIEPGPALGRMLEELREAQIQGQVATREQALGYVQHLVKRDGPSI